MGEVIPVVLVVIFWMIIGVFAVTFFRRSLRIPTETEVEVEEMHAHAHGSHEAGAREDKVGQAAAH